MAVKTRKKTKMPVFWIGYAFFLVTLAVFWIYVLRYVYKCLVAYEASQPERVIETLAKSLEEGKAEEIFTFPASPSRFQEPDIIKTRFLDVLAGQAITFEKDPGSYDSKNPLYRLFAGDRQIAGITLRELSSEPLMFILSKQEWEVASAVPVLETGPLDLQVHIPDSCTLRVNGIEAGSQEMTGNRWEIPEFSYAAQYTAVPGIVEYSITGLFEEPQIEIYDSYGAPMEYTRTGSVIEASAFPSSDMDEELAAYALENAINYSNFFSRDLPGCSKSVAPLKYMFPEDSEFLKLAENYRRHDMWMYSNHHAPSFANEEVRDYVQYSEDFFSCNVYFEKSMQLITTGEIRTVITNDTYYYVKIDGKWLIADMRTNIQEQ